MERQGSIDCESDYTEGVESIVSAHIELEGTTKPVVLVVDDDWAVRAAVAEDLKREDYSLFFAENGQDGLTLVREAHPMVILLDLRMPKMDGFEFLAELDLKATDPYSVIVLTGHGNAEAVKECYDAGVSIFLKKPFNLYEIRGVVRNAITVKQLTIRLEAMVQERTNELELRMREVTALNRMFQHQIDQRSEMVLDYIDQLDELHQLMERIGALAHRAQTRQIPHVHNRQLVDEDEGSTL